MTVRIIPILELLRARSRSWLTSVHGNPASARPDAGRRHRPVIPAKLRRCDFLVNSAALSGGQGCLLNGIQLRFEPPRPLRQTAPSQE